jgi:hypothetical protein
MKLWVLVLLLVAIIFIKGPSVTSKEPDGLMIIKNAISPSEIQMLKHCDNRQRQDFITSNPGILESIREKLGPSYTFHDYIFVIKKSSIHTCHRDANGSLFNKGQKHPSYTLILYLDPPTNGCLATAPGSHDGRWFSSGFTNVTCEPGDVFLFDANLVHAGTITSTNNLRIQMKVSHVDDLETLSFYQKYHKVAEKENKLPSFLKRLHQNFTCMFPFISDMTQDEVKDLDGNFSNKKIPQKVFSKLFYGDEKFYELPDAY